MSELQGADLALAMAKAMGRDGYVDDAGQCQIKAWGWHRGWHHCHFSPHLGGAAGAEVLDFLPLTVTVEFFEAGDVTCELYSSIADARCVVVGHGSTRWAALCRAVVAWEEERETVHG